MTPKNLADQLELVLEGRIELEGVLNEISQAGEPLASCVHGLEHFLADEDLRSRDPEYRAMQVTEMRKLITRLRGGAGSVTLAKIHFLGASREP